LRDIVTTETHIVTATIERDLGTNFKFTNGSRFLSNDRFSRVTAPRGLGNAADQPFNSGINIGTGGSSTGYPVDAMTIGRERRERETDATYLVNQTDLIGKFDTGIVNHTVATGIEVSRETRNQTRTDLCVPTSGSGTTASPIAGTAACYTSLVNPSAGGVPATGATVVAPNHTVSTDVGAYVSDQMKITKYWELLGSVRYDKFHTDYTDLSQAMPAAQYLSSTDTMLGWRYGAVFHPTAVSSIYYASGVSFNPSAELGTLSTGTISAAPEKTTSYEVGAKADVLDGGRLSLSGALFRIEKTNMRVPLDPTQTGAAAVQILDGVARSDGYEIGAVGKFTDKWSASVGFTQLWTKLLQTTDLSQLGRQMPNAPPRSLSIWNTYEITSQFTVGGGATYNSDAFANAQNTAYVPAYWKFDAMASYKVDAKSTIQLNIYNITNAFYFAQYYGGQAVPASGRWASLSYRYRW
jgi:catecholate siderophore receptor